MSKGEWNVITNREFVIEKLQCSPTKYPTVLEKKYPHVLERIVRLWDTREGEDYLNDLLKPTYSGGRHEREGFHEKAWDEILYLLTLYQKPRPKQNLNGDSEPQLSNSGLLDTLMGVFNKSKR